MESGFVKFQHQHVIVKSENDRIQVTKSIETLMTK